MDGATVLQGATQQGPTRRAALARRSILATAFTLLPLAMGLGAATAQAPLTIGVLNDMSGPTADLSGPGAVISAEFAVADFGGSVLGRPIVLLKADTQAKADLGIGLARQWYDEGVAAIFDVGITTIALGVQQLARDKNKVVVFTSTGTSDLTGKLCSPNGIHWTYDSYAFSVVAAQANMRAYPSKKKWFFMTVDYAYGRSLEAEATNYLNAHGGTAVGSARHPFDTKDFSSDLLTAKNSGADVIALATPTAQASAIIKQSAEFGFTKDGPQTLQPIGMLLNDVRGLGLEVTQGLLVTEPYYWDLDEGSRKFGERFRQRFGKMPNSYQASVYGAVTHYLNAVKTAGTDAAKDVVKAMKDTPVRDFMTANGRIRPDGRTIRDFHVFRVKTPAESKAPEDLYAFVATIPGDQAFKAPDPACELVK